MTGDGSPTITGFGIKDRRERSYVRLRFCWKRSTCRQVLFITLWTRVVGGEEIRAIRNGRAFHGGTLHLP